MANLRTEITDSEGGRIAVEAIDVSPGRYAIELAADSPLAMQIETDGYLEFNGVFHGNRKFIVRGTQYEPDTTIFYVQAQ